MTPLGLRRYSFLNLVISLLNFLSSFFHSLFRILYQCSEVNSHHNQERSSMCFLDYVLMKKILEYVTDDRILAELQFPGEEETIN